MSESDQGSEYEEDVEDLKEYSDADVWKATIDAVLPAIVVIKMNSTRNVDDSSSGGSEATGHVSLPISQPHLSATS
jgi:capsid protein